MRISLKHKRIITFLMAMILIVCQGGSVWAVYPIQLTYAAPGEDTRDVMRLPEQEYMIPASEEECIVYGYTEENPFKFGVEKSGIYEIEYNSQTEVLRITYIASLEYNEDRTTINKAQYGEERFEQAGITMDSGEGTIAPRFNIAEITTYLTKSEFKESDIVNGGKENIVIGNAEYNGKLRDNYFAFIASPTSKEEVDNVLLPMGYRYSGESGEGRYYYNRPADESGGTSELIIAEPELAGGDGELKKKISFNESQDDLKFIKIVYQLDGYSEASGLNSVSSIEELLSRLFMSLGDILLIKQIRNLFGDDLSIYSLVFNRYEDTKIDLYNKGGTKINNAVRTVVNKWFKTLSNFVYICFIIILIYIGIMGIISAGSEKQDKIKGYLSSWITALLILLFVPSFALEYIITLNNTFVEFVSTKATQTKTYYNIYSEEGEIQGSDSATVRVEDLLIEKDDAEVAKKNAEDEIEIAKEDIIKRIKKELQDKFSSEELAANVSGLLNELDWGATRLDAEVTSEDEAEAMKKVALSILRRIDRLQLEWIKTMGIDRSDKFIAAIREVLFDIDEAAGKWMIKEDYWEKFKDLRRITNEKKIKIKEIDEKLEIVKSDLMGRMRVEAGETRRLVYVFVWYVLIFQLITLIVIYFKRIFVIGILITIFPLIALFYCIDKMADNSSQTLKLWFKEFLSNVFVQSIHAVMYIVLVEMGVIIYKENPDNWIWFVGAVMMLVPAEAMLKSIFGLDGSTVKKLSSSAMKTLAVAGAGVALLKSKSTRGEKNKAAQTKLQNKQNKADFKASIRSDKRISSGKSEDGSATSRLGKIREGVYNAASHARNFAMKNVGKVGAVKDVARGVAAVTATTAYMASEGFSPESAVAGAKMAKSISGRTAKKSTKTDLKSELSGAWARKQEAKKSKK